MASAPAVLVVTTFDLDEYVYEALRAGACGFLLKDAPEEQLVAALRGALDGISLLRPVVTRRLVEAFTRPAPSDLSTIEELTTREREVLVLVARACPTPRSPATWPSARPRSGPTCRGC